MIAGREISVRPATAHDRPAVDRLVAEASEHLRGRRGGTEASEIDPYTAERLLVATIEPSEVVGFAAVDVTPRTCTLRAIFVGAAVRQVGVGAALLAATAELGRTARCDVLDASALPGDRDAKNFFETHGLTAREIVVQRVL